MRNIGASVRTKLLNISRKTGRSNEYLLIQYFYERFLYRLGKSKHRNRLILKGGMLLISYDSLNRSRPTKDLDFLAKGLPIKADKVKPIIEEILNSADSNDGVLFDANSIQVEQITEDQDYTGIRVFFVAQLADTKVRTRLHLDIPVGDSIVPSPIEMEYPVLLDFEAPKVMAYSKETVIAEKLETIVKRSTANSRLKDFYDIYYLAKTTNFSLDVLSNSIKSTFMNRGTPLPEETFFPEMIKDDSGMEIRWKAFISRHGQLTDISYQELVKKLDSFTRPIIMKNQEESIWDFNTWRWASTL